MSDGWQSRGELVQCPKCRETGSLIETIIYGKVTRAFFCNVCSHAWRETREVREIGR